MLVISKAKQQGLTMIGLLLVLTVSGFFVLLGLKLGPIYSEDYTINSILAGLKNDPTIGKKSPQEIRFMFGQRLNMNNIQRVKVEDLEIKRDRNNLQLNLNYDAQENVVSNVDVLVHFQHTVELPVN